MRSKQLNAETCGFLYDSWVILCHSEAYITDRNISVKLSETPSTHTRPGLFGRLRERLGATRRALAGDLDKLLGGGRRLDAELLEELETLLLSADVGVETTGRCSRTCISDCPAGRRQGCRR